MFNFTQKDILSNEQCRLILAETKTSSLLSKSTKRLGDVADIVTGFYTGDNLRFIKAANKDVKGSKNYKIISPEQVFSCNSLHGIADIQEGYVPYIKSASKRRYVRQQDEWYVRWDKETIEFYNKNKKSRFQNSSFYFKTGIGIPMVKSSVVKAFLMRDRVFDQSIVGIFPKESSKLHYILALMNSDIINELIHAINPSANNSANYIKQLPYVEPSKEYLELIDNMVQEIVLSEESENYDRADELHTELNAIINTIYS